MDKNIKQWREEKEKVHKALKKEENAELQEKLEAIYNYVQAMCKHHPRLEDYEKKKQKIPAINSSISING